LSLQIKTYFNSKLWGGNPCGYPLKPLCIPTYNVKTKSCRLRSPIPYLINLFAILYMIETKDKHAVRIYDK